MNMNLSISNQERIDLKRLLDTNDCENNTEHIRKVKHSLKIQKDVMDLVTLKKSRGKVSETDQTRPATMSPTELVRVFISSYTDRKEKWDYIGE